MTIKGYRFIKAKDKGRLELISNYIWSLNFTKERPVQISYDETVSEISAMLSSARYLITVRPDTELEEIKNLLLKKKYIKVEDNRKYSLGFCPYCNGQGLLNIVRDEDSTIYITCDEAGHNFDSMEDVKNEKFKERHNFNYNYISLEDAIKTGYEDYIFIFEDNQWKKLK